MPTHKYSSNSKTVRPSSTHLNEATGRLTPLEFQKKEIEWQEKTNFQKERGLHAKHEQEKIKADVEWIKADIEQINFDKAKVTRTIGETELDILEVRSDARLLELGMEEDKLNVLEIRAELEHTKSVEQLQKLSMEIDDLKFENNMHREIGEFQGIHYTTRSLPVQSIKAYLKDGLNSEK